MTDIIRVPQLGDAEQLFPQLYRTSVTDGIAWDGPDSRDDYVTRLGVIIDEVRRRERHFFTIVAPDSATPIGSCDVRPDGQLFRATVGIWIGESQQGRGLGTRAIAELVRYAFETLQLHKVDAEIFVDNWASRRAFEKNGFALEGTVRGALLKRGVPLDEWLLGLVNPASRFADAAMTRQNVTR
jgi:RimJ/RimL family protein N-acetyltransferase